MNCTYQYQGFDIEVAVEAEFNWRGGRTATGEVGYVAGVRICKADVAVAVFSPHPPRFGESQDKPFLSKADALMDGYSVGRRIVDDLFIVSRSADKTNQSLGYLESIVCSCRMTND
jgi:hypothetical protein